LEKEPDVENDWLVALYLLVHGGIIDTAIAMAMSQTSERGSFKSSVHCNYIGYFSFKFSSDSTTCTRAVVN